MTAFHDVRFPVDIAYGASGGPEFSTDVVISHSGYEQRNINWLDARGVYQVAHGVKTAAQLAELIAFFRARQGRAYAFRFKDWSDYTASAQVIGTGNGTISTFQLVKVYNSGGYSHTRTITKPVDNSVHIYVNNVLQSSGISVNTSTGVVTFASAPANGAAITASFEFDVPVRFDTDRLSSSLEDYSVHSWRDIPLVEVRG